MQRGIQYNGSGYYDETAYHAILNCERKQLVQTLPARFARKHRIGVMRFDEVRAYQPREEGTGGVAS